MNRIHQSSAVPFRIRDGAPEYLLITNHKGHWIFPKGIIDPGETAVETAIKEAREEAGIQGRIVGAPIGTYTYEKWDSVLDVTVYLLEVQTEDAGWLEEGERRRAWFRLGDARSVMTNKKLLKVLEKAHAALSAGMSPQPNKG